MFQSAFLIIFTVLAILSKIVFHPNAQVRHFKVLACVISMLFTVCLNKFLFSRYASMKLGCINKDSHISYTLLFKKIMLKLTTFCISLDHFLPPQTGWAPPPPVALSQLFSNLCTQPKSIFGLSTKLLET